MNTEIETYSLLIENKYMLYRDAKVKQLIDDLRLLVIRLGDEWENETDKLRKKNLYLIVREKMDLLNTLEKMAREEVK